MRRGPLRHLLELTVSVLVAALVVRTWLVMGLVVPVTVSGSSMSPTLAGPHRTFHCPDCRTDFSIGLDQQPNDLRAVCPVCGSRRARAPDEEVTGGDRIIIDRAAYAWREPRRWEVVVFRCPQQADQLCVKRVVGLPGERVSLAHGDLYIGGQLVRKSLDEQQALRQLVYRAAESRDLASLDEPVWKIDLAPIPDAMLTAEVCLAESGQLRMEMNCEAGRFKLVFIAAEDELRLIRDGHVIAARTLVIAGPREVYSRWTLSLFDRQALVAVNDQIVLEVPYESDDGVACPRSPGHAHAKQVSLQASVGMFDASREHATRPEQPTSPSFPAQPQRTFVAIYGLGGEIREPAVWRDAYYAYRYGDRPNSAGAASADAARWQLGPHEYFVLGDNAEISDDSRSWSTRPGLDAKLLVGKPLGVR